jgi:replicative DNA helicase
MISPEVAIIILILTDPSVHEEVFGDLQDLHFANHELKDVFRRCRNRYLDGKPIDITTIEVPHTVMNSLAEYSHMSSQVSGLIAELVERHNTGKTKEIGYGIIHMIEKEESLQNVLEYINSKTDEIITGHSNTTMSLADLVEEYGNEKCFNEMSRSVLQTGLTDVDRKLIIRNGDLIILAGRPSMGKTALALSMSKRIGQHSPVGFISLEMRSESLLYRLAMSEGRSSGYSGYAEGCMKLYNLPIYFDDNPRQNLAVLRQKIKTMVQKFNIKVLFIDYLTLLDPPDGENRNLQVTKLSYGLKTLAREYDIPIVVLSQLNRAVENRADKRPQLSDLRDSGAIEQDADIVMFAYRPVKYGVDDINGVPTKNYFELIVDKQRNGETGLVKLFYNPEVQKFGDWTDGSVF